MIGEIDGVKIYLTPEQYKKYKKSLEEQLEEKDKEIERLNNIIKEVREYIEENTNSDSFTTLTSGKTTDIPYCIVAFEDILEIIEKEN